jgi:hypothetical protein
MGLSITYYFGDYTTKNGTGPIQTSSIVFNNIFNSIFHTAAAVALMLTLFLDNTIPGSDEERGLHVWTTLVVDDEGNQTDWWEDDHLNRVSSVFVGVVVGVLVVSLACDCSFELYKMGICCFWCGGGSQTGSTAGVHVWTTLLVVADGVQISLERLSLRTTLDKGGPTWVVRGH